MSVSVDRPPGAVYAYIRDPRNLPTWAPGFARSVRRDGDAWVVETADGPVRITFAPDNDLGVVDHQVIGPGGPDVTNPMRVVANGQGSEVLFTLLAPAGATEPLDSDARLVESDLQTLKRVLEAGDQA